MRQKVWYVHVLDIFCLYSTCLVGPCALDYTKMKTSDHFWTDPPADELVQRHRIHSGGHHMTPGAASPGSPKRPGLQVRPQVRLGLMIISFYDKLNEH